MHIHFGLNPNLRQARPFVGIALILFIGGMILGIAFSTPLHGILTPMLQGLKQEAAALRQDNSGGIFMALFVNNVRVSLIMMVGGIFLGLIPAFGVLANGALMGYVVAIMVAKTHISPVLVFAAGILPHGIFEIPAYLLASAYGLRFGWHMIRVVAGKTTKEGWRTLLIDAGTTVFWVAGLLFIAAFIETNITPVLLRAVLAAK